MTSLASGVKPHLHVKKKAVCGSRILEILVATDIAALFGNQRSLISTSYFFIQDIIRSKLRLSAEVVEVVVKVVFY